MLFHLRENTAENNSIRSTKGKSNMNKLFYYTHAAYRIHRAQYVGYTERIQMKNVYIHMYVCMFVHTYITNVKH